MSKKYLIVYDIMKILIGENDSDYIKHGKSEMNEKIRLDGVVRKYVALLQENPLENDKENIMRELNRIIDKQKQINQAFSIRVWTKALAEGYLIYATDYNQDFEEFKIIDDAVRVCIEFVVKETSHKTYSLWKQYVDDELFRSKHMKNVKDGVSYSSRDELPWQTIIKDDAYEIKTQMIETLKAMAIQMSTMTKDQIITSPEYSKLFPVTIIKKSEHKIKLQAAGKRKKPESP